MRLPSLEHKLWPWLTAAFVFVVYAIYSFTRYRQLLSTGYDLGIFDQAVQQYAAFHAPQVALKGEHYNILGDHFHPILILLAPLYWIWNDPRMLGVALAALIALSCPLVYAFARRRLGGSVPVPHRGLRLRPADAILWRL